MNECIKELSMEAETYARSICNPAGNYRNEETDEVKPFWRVSREKFAELIIKEVLAVQEQLIAEGHNAWHVNKPTREHFGVE